MEKYNNKLRDITYKDFCILMDRTSTFDTYKKVFDYLNIPLNVYKDNDITSFDEVVLINNILSFILDIKRKNYEKIKCIPKGFSIYHRESIL